MMLYGVRRRGAGVRGWFGNSLERIGLPPSSLARTRLTLICFLIVLPLLHLLRPATSRQRGWKSHGEYKAAEQPHISHVGGKRADKDGSNPEYNEIALAEKSGTWREQHHHGQTSRMHTHHKSIHAVVHSANGAGYTSETSKKDPQDGVSVTKFSRVNPQVETHTQSISRSKPAHASRAQPPKASEVIQEDVRAMVLGQSQGTEEPEDLGDDREDSADAVATRVVADALQDVLPLELQRESKAEVDAESSFLNNLASVQEAVVQEDEMSGQDADDDGGDAVGDGSDVGDGGGLGKEEYADGFDDRDDALPVPHDQATTTQDHGSTHQKQYTYDARKGDLVVVRKKLHPPHPHSAASACKHWHQCDEWNHLVAKAAIVEDKSNLQREERRAETRRSAQAWAEQLAASKPADLACAMAEAEEDSEGSSSWEGAVLACARAVLSESRLERALDLPAMARAEVGARLGVDASTGHVAAILNRELAHVARGDALAVAREALAQAKQKRRISKQGGTRIREQGAYRSMARGGAPALTKGGVPRGLDPTALEQQEGPGGEGDGEISVASDMVAAALRSWSNGKQDLKYTEAVASSAEALGLGLRWTRREHRPDPLLLHALQFLPQGQPMPVNRSKLDPIISVERAGAVGTTMHEYKFLSGMLATLPLRDRTWRYETCAVVGNSGRLLHSHPKRGPAIDANHAVIRLNYAPVGGYEKYVGSSTTFDVISQEVTKQLLANPSQPARLINSTLIVYEATAPFARLHLYPKLIRRFAGISYESPRVGVLSVQLIGSAHQVWRQMKSAVEDALGEVGQRREFHPEPMAGYFAVAFAAQICEFINLYGFSKYAGPGDKERFHYYQADAGYTDKFSYDLSYELFRILGTWPGSDLYGRIHFHR